MPTDDKYVRLYNKRILPLIQFKDNFLDYMRQYIESVQSANYNLPTTIGLVAVPITAPGNNNVTVGNTGGPFKGTTGLGGIIKFGNADSRLTAVPVPPVAVRFDVGLERALVEDGVETNPRTGEIEYSNVREEIGRLATPDLITNNGGLTLTIRCDAIFGTDDATGRQVRVWLKPKQSGGTVGPQSTSTAVAFETRTVSFSGGHNIITTAAILGQNSASPSTTAADYIICAVGPTIRKHSVEDLTLTSGCWFIGFLTGATAGNPCTGLSTAGQNLVSATLSDLAPILRRDAHLSLKLRVKADASDSNEPQIDVWNSSNVTVFVINETGNLTVTATAGVAGTFSSVSTAAAVQANATGTGNAFESVKGDVQLPATNKYKFATNRSRSLHIPAIAFIRTGEWLTQQTNARYLNSQEGKTGHASLVCSPREPGQFAHLNARAEFHIPNGATITSLTVLSQEDYGNGGSDGGFSNFSSQEGTLRAFKRTFSGGVITQTLINSGTGMFSTGSGSSGQVFSENTVATNAHVVDNTSGWYELVLDLISQYKAVGAFNGNVSAATAGGTRMALLKDGRVLISGGEGGGTIKTNAYIYDSVTGVVTAVTGMNHARADHQLFSQYNGKVMALGGRSDVAGNVGVTICELYDPDADTWTDLSGSLANPLEPQMILGPTGEHVYVLGGRDSAGANTPRVFNVVNQSGVFALGNSPADRSGCTLVWYKPDVNDAYRLAAIGGGANTSASSTTFDSYSPTPDSWSAGTGALSAAVNTPGAITLPSGAILVFGGSASATAHYGTSAGAAADNKLTFNTITAPTVNMSQVQTYELPDGDVLCLQGSSGFRAQKYSFKGAANANSGEWKVIADGDGTSINDSAFTASARTGYRVGGPGVMMPNGEVIFFSNGGSTIWHMDPRRHTMMQSQRRPCIRVFGVRVNYDYAEVTPEM